MVRRTLMGALVFTGIVSAGDHLAACGDKYLSLGLGTHYERSAAERRAARVLFYAETGSELSRLLTTLSVEAGMRKGGYQPAIVSSSPELKRALGTRNWDVVVVDGRDAQTIMQLMSNKAGPRVVPVLTRPTRDELKQARKTYVTVIDSPGKNRVFLDVVDDALDLHERDAAALAKAARSSAR